MGQKFCIQVLRKNWKSPELVYVPKSEWSLWYLTIKNFSRGDFALILPDQDLSTNYLPKGDEKTKMTFAAERVEISTSTLSYQSCEDRNGNSF